MRLTARRKLKDKPGRLYRPDRDAEDAPTSATKGTSPAAAIEHIVVSGDADGK
jgi:hypothetical protein